MKNSHFVYALLLAGLTAPAVTPALAQVPENATAEQIVANTQSEALGAQIYRHDQAAWHGSDTLRGQISFNDHPEIHSYVTEELPNGNIGLVYVADIDGALFEFARFEVSDEAVVSGGMVANPADRPLSDSLKRSVSARQVALDLGVKEKIQLCASNSANVVILPPDEADEISVYILSSPSVRGRFPIGGHYLVKVDAENQIASARVFENSCRDGPLMERYVPGGPGDFEIVHLLDPHPTEIHYFAARNMRVPLKVTAAEVTWTIDYSNWTDAEIAAAEALIGQPD